MWYRRKHNGGFYLIGLLIALLIIMILTGKYMSGDRERGVPPAQTNIDKSKSAACSANRMQMQTQIQMWSINHLGETPTVEKLRQANINVPRCPAGGEYYITPKGDILCSVHDKDIYPHQENTP